MSDELRKSMTDFRDMLLISTLPDELTERIEKFTSKKLNPKKMSKKEMSELTEIIAELKKYNALALIGME